MFYSIKIPYDKSIKVQFIDLKSQYKILESNINVRLKDICENTRFIMGAEVQEIEKKLSEYTQAKYAIGCASGTDALQIALMALNLQPGDEVITTPFTFFATGEVIALLGLKPIFVDIKEDSYNINPSLIEANITNNTKAIIPVSLYGQCADMDVINSIAAKHNIPVIEDAAQSFGAEYKGHKSCNLSTIGTASFFPSKPLGCYGDGGMIFTNDEKLAADMKMIGNHGQERRYYHSKIGINSRLDTMQAAILLAKMELFADEVRKRSEIGARYTELLQNYVRTPIVQKNNTHVYAQYTIEVDNRDVFCAKMQEKNIPTAVHYPVPLHFQPVFKDLGFEKGDFPVAENVSKRVVSLPMHPYLDEATQDEIVAGVKECI
jgi:UDP-2-acetamido-2-deoxy-ribo-hexuluronate aminotransferase